MRYHIRRSIISLLVLLALTALIAPLSLATASRHADAQQSPQELDVDQVVERAERYLTALITLDADADGFADYDATGDRVGEIKVEHVDDLAIQPGQTEFTELLESALKLGTADVTGTPFVGDCSGILLSFDDSGNLIDSALVAGSGHGGGQVGVAMDLFPQHVTGSAIFTEQNPFTIGQRVLVIGQGGSDNESADETHPRGWQLSSAGLQLAAGSVVTTNMIVSDVSVSDHAPLGGMAAPVGLFPIDLDFDAAGAALCQTDGWVQFTPGSPLFTNVGIAASGLSVVGAIGMFWNARPARVWKKEDEA